MVFNVVHITNNLERRFWAKVHKTETCWLWRAAKNANGYGRIGAGPKRGGTVGAHRLSWMIHRGDIPDGYAVLHACDQPACVNPAHLFLGTQAENVADMIAKGRRRKDMRGESSPVAKLSEADVIAIREARANGVSSSVLGRQYGITPSHAIYIGSRKTWKHVE